MNIFRHITLFPKIRRTKSVWDPQVGAWRGVSRLGELLPQIPDHAYGPDARPLTIRPMRSDDAH
jgi:hypothetical protein